MNRLPLYIIPALLFLGACQPGMMQRTDDTLFGRFAGGEFTLHHEVVIAPGRARVIFQDGRVGTGASEFAPRCEVEVKHILDTPQTMPAGSYRIGKVVGMRRYVERPPGGIMLAAGDDSMRLADGTTGDWFMSTYRMQLYTGLDEEAPLLVCGGAYNYAFYARYPTLQEMRDALGEHATLTLHISGARPD